MKTKLISLILLMLTCINIQATVDSTFTYQGELTDSGSPAQGTYDITINAFDNDSASGTALSSSVHTDISVNAGLFTIQEVDLGSMIYDGMDLWLQIQVKKSAEASFTALSPLQKMRSVPYASSLIDKGAVDGQVLTFNVVTGWQPSTPMVANSVLNGTNLTIGITGGTSQVIDLSTLQGATSLNDLSDGKSDANFSNVYLGSGAGAASFNGNADNGNVGIGETALFSNLIDGRANVAVGSSALFSNTSGDSNTGIGSSSLFSNTTASNNTAIGSQSLRLNSTGASNTANGFSSLYNNDTGDFNTASGSNSLLANTIGSGNTSSGADSMFNNISGNDNTAFGVASLRANTTASENTAIGAFSLNANTSTALRNSALGSSSLRRNTLGFDNTAIGAYSLQNNIDGDRNVAVGSFALSANTTGGNNTALGYDAFVTGNFFNSTAIGAFAQPNASDTVRIGNSTIATIGGFANWTNVSDARFKKNVKQDVPGLVFINMLRPVSYQLDMDAIAAFNKTPDDARLANSEILKASEIQTGFVAQEVEAAATSLGFDFHGIDKPKNNSSHYGLRYAEFVVPLVKAVQELSDSNQQLKAENQLLKDRLDHIERLLTK
ncbi:MAG: tail fiber domain-containing protein [Marinicellaceae bacterium]